MMSLDRAPEDCPHCDIEFIGSSHDTTFFRCRSCGSVFVRQGSLLLKVPAARPRRAEN
jgi:ribosomal protein L37AE/L43A